MQLIIVLFKFKVRMLHSNFFGLNLLAVKFLLITFELGVELTPLKKPFHQLLEVKMTPQLLGSKSHS
jgi:hypothetical protein